MPSTVIAKIDYFPETLRLRIKFLSGLVYEYKNVPAEVYKAFRISGSKGRFLNFHIKGKFEFEKIS